MTLDTFIATNPPHDTTIPAPPELLDGFADQVPECLVALWREHGLGFYGPRQLCLIDPRDWQATLDRWIVSPPGEVRRIPIALTPFGGIVLYRKPTETDEDVAVVDPIRRSMDILTFDLVDFFNVFMADTESAETLISSEMLDTARQAEGGLEPGQVYEADPEMIPAQVLKFGRKDGLESHKRLRDMIDAPPPSKADPQGTIGDLLPDAFREVFAGAENRGGPDIPEAGLYFATHVGRHRLLALGPDYSYRLLFWMTDPRAFRPDEPRLYSGAYVSGRKDGGDTIIRLDMAEKPESSSDDFDDWELIVMQSGDARRLLQSRALKHIASNIGWNNTIGEPRAVFTGARLSDPIPPYSEDGGAAPPWSDLPPALQRLVRREPLTATITQLEPFTDSGDEDATFTVTIDLGTDDGLSMNMPFSSPAGSGKAHHGWVWRLDPKACGLGLAVNRDDNGKIIDRPEIGDVLTSRQSASQTEESSDGTPEVP